ncbi:LacI family DNA-binding transcriptional regulator [Plebeiibacterium marinum]|uniref:LacI family transcriptional regulator n=1 Tax=Plebeiibacterium marinum TaxID=2992111 RepID=A0AAE3MET4_9BACT|nr:LacI family DNA-binding transcriptional regulator [Plebeiobacterium marinum]MCW3806292.1 LacI family transcriptional regulator [Plebeiobacterium marinum]
MKRNPATLKDIAEKLGLNKSTVSRALKDHPDVSQKTRDMVKRMAKKLHYVPNTVAASLRHKKSKVIGLLAPQISHFFLPSVIEGIEEVVHKYGYNLLILQSKESYEREVENLDILIANNVEGIIASVSRTTTDFTHFQQVINMGLPMVFYDRVVQDINTDVVLLDDTSAAFDAVSHLISKQRKKIAICTGNINLLISRNRLNGYKSALKNYGIEYNEDYVISCEWPEEAKRKTIDLLELPDPPDAIFAISDLTLSGVMQAIYSKGLPVPNDISVVAFCEEPFRSMYNPVITAIQPKGLEIGKTSAEMLFQRIKISPFADPEPRVVYLDGQLIVGGST